MKSRSNRPREPHYLGYRDEKDRVRVFHIGHSPVLYELPLPVHAAGGAKAFDWGNTAAPAQLLSLAILADYLRDDELAARLNRIHRHGDRQAGLRSALAASAPRYGGSRKKAEAGGGMIRPEQAQQMLDAFTSVGAERFFVTKTNVREDKTLAWPTSPERLREVLPAVLRAAAVRKPCDVGGGRTIMAGENVIVRPMSRTSAFIQLDDLTADALERVRAVAFLTLATSPGNHQAWLAISDLKGRIPQDDVKDFVRRVKKGVGDKSASGASKKMTSLGSSSVTAVVALGRLDASSRITDGSETSGSGARRAS